jgi:predicted RNase H-like HicB family nuclease
MKAKSNGEGCMFFRFIAVMESKYEMVIYWSDEDKSFIVEVPELPGCMADGKTYCEAVSNAELVVHQWIDTAT